MFFASKLLNLFAQPLTWIAALLVASLLAHRRPALAQKLVGLALSLLLLMGWQPLPHGLLRQLEVQYAEIPFDADLRTFTGVVILGGSTEEAYIAEAHTQPLLNEAAERMMGPIAMLRRNPHLRLVFTGGEGSFMASGPSEAERVRPFFDSMGIGRSEVTYEARSRTTYENAVLTAQLPGININQRWLLVTTASHMPRSMATFKKVGWNVAAYPVDFRTGNDTPWTAYSLKDGARNWQLLLHEYLGLLAYRLTGRL
ncbi:MAG TPA: YdcF family protein [Rhodoferax sp.]|nr:YdcF family protein [Rhodoferax sp.]HNV60480.1 YdcF family protein [Rhodoferax sp.]HPW29074.1 YdcF family protein [Rhodoferax sp.]